MVTAQGTDSPAEPGPGSDGRPLFSEYVTETAAYQSPGDVDWAVRCRPAGVLGVPPVLGGVGMSKLLPLLRGNGLLSACPRPGLCHQVLPQGGRHAHRRSLRPERGDARDGGRQPGSALPQAAWELSRLGSISFCRWPLSSRGGFEATSTHPPRCAPCYPPRTGRPSWGRQTACCRVSRQRQRFTEHTRARDTRRSTRAARSTFARRDSGVSPRTTLKRGWIQPEALA